jgi:hypothetical protein
MNIDQAKWFLRVFANGKKLNTLTIRELYLSGYLGIELRSPGREPLPTVITEKGKRVLETASRHVIPLWDSAERSLRFSSSNKPERVAHRAGSVRRGTPCATYF